MKTVGSAFVLALMAMLPASHAQAPQTAPVFVGRDVFSASGCTKDFPIAFSTPERITIGLDGNRADSRPGGRTYSHCGWAVWMDPASLPTNKRFQVYRATFSGHLTASRGGYIDYFDIAPAYQSTWGDAGIWDDSKVGLGGPYKISPWLGGNRFPAVGWNETSYDGPFELSTGRTYAQGASQWSQCFTKEYKDTVKRPTIYTQIVGYVRPEAYDAITTPGGIGNATAVVGKEGENTWLTVHLDVKWEDCA